MNDNPATRHDVEEIVTKVVTEASQQILNAVGDQITTVISQLDDVRDDTSHIKNRLDYAADKVDDYEVRITKLENRQV